MPPIHGVLKTALYVDDLARARAFQISSLGLAPLFGHARLSALDAGHRSVLLLVLRGATPEEVRLPGGVTPPWPSPWTSSNWRSPGRGPPIAPAAPDAELVIGRVDPAVAAAT